MRAARPNHCSPHAGKLYNTAETERCGQHVWGRRATRTPCTFQIPLLVNSHKCRMTRAPPTHSQRIKAKRIHTHVLLWRRRPKGRQQRGQSRKLGTCVLWASGQFAKPPKPVHANTSTHMCMPSCNERCQMLQPTDPRSTSPLRKARSWVEKGAVVSDHAKIPLHCKPHCATCVFMPVRNTHCDFIVAFALCAKGVLSDVWPAHHFLARPPHRPLPKSMCCVANRRPSSLSPGLDGGTS